MENFIANRPTSTFLGIALFSLIVGVGVTWIVVGVVERNNQPRADACISAGLEPLWIDHEVNACISQDGTFVAVPDVKEN